MATLKEPGAMYYTIEAHGTDTGYNKHFIGHLCAIGAFVVFVEWVFTLIATQAVQFIDYGWFWVVFTSVDGVVWLIMLTGLIFYFISNSTNNVIYMPGAFSMKFVMAFIATTIAWAVKIAVQANWLWTYKGSAIAFGASTAPTFPDPSMPLEYFQFYVVYTLSEVMLFIAFLYLLEATVAHFKPVRGLGHIAMQNLSTGAAGQAGQNEYQQYPLINAQAQFQQQQYNVQANLQNGQPPTRMILYQSPLPGMQ